MANTDEKILKALENIQADVKDLKQGQGNLAQGQTETHKRLSNLEDGQAHLTTAVEALAAGQQDVRAGIKIVEATVGEARAELKTDILTIDKKLVRKVQSHEN